MDLRCRVLWAAGWGRGTGGEVRTHHIAILPVCLLCISFRAVLVSLSARDDTLLLLLFAWTQASQPWRPSSPSRTFQTSLGSLVTYGSSLGRLGPCFCCTGRREGWRRERHEGTEMSEVRCCAAVPQKMLSLPVLKLLDNGQ